jgi:hypothetical protein
MRPQEGWLAVVIEEICEQKEEKIRSFIRTYDFAGKSDRRFQVWNTKKGLFWLGNAYKIKNNIISFLKNKNSTFSALSTKFPSNTKPAEEFLDFSGNSTEFWAYFLNNCPVIFSRTASDGPTDADVMILKYTLKAVWREAGCTDQSEAMHEWLEKAEESRDANNHHGHRQGRHRYNRTPLRLRLRHRLTPHRLEDSVGVRQSWSTVMIGIIVVIAMMPTTATAGQQYKK